MAATKRVQIVLRPTADVNKVIRSRAKAAGLSINAFIESQFGGGRKSKAKAKK